MFHDISRPSSQFLHAQKWFAELPPETQLRIADKVFTLQGSKGDVMLRAGEQVQGWYAVLSGLVKLQSQSSQGRRSAYLGIPGGEWFGEGAAMKNEPRRYDVIALRDSQLLCLPIAEFTELHASSLVFNRALAAQLNMRLSQAMAIIETMRLRTPEQRVAMYLGRHLWRGPRKMSLSQEELGLVALEFGRVSILSDEGLMALAMKPEPDPEPDGD